MSPVDETIDADETVQDVIDRFAAGTSRHLVVLDCAGRCLGIVGSRHLAQVHHFDLRRDEEIPVRDLGYVPWIALNPDDDLCTCAQMLVEHDVDAIPVLDPDRRVLGLVTTRDIARAAADASAHEHPRWEE
jgi:L-aspartate semialdehyde sulfurtransferase